jgi:hypothetical protein
MKLHGVKVLTADMLVKFVKVLFNSSRTRWPPKTATHICIVDEQLVPNEGTSLQRNNKNEILT